MTAPAQPQRLSRPIEVLFEGLGPARERSQRPVGTLIVGSGYGAALAALALVERGETDICVLERGREFVPGEFPKTFGTAPGQFSVTDASGTFGYPQGLWDVRLGKGMSALIGRGVGGGSLINANVAFAPPEEFLDAWPLPPGTNRESWKARFKDDVAVTKKLLIDDDADSKRRRNELTQLPKYRELERLCAKLEGGKIRPVDLTVSFRTGSNHLGVQQNACIQCGNCVSGCNAGAKGSLDMNVWPVVVSAGVTLYRDATVSELEQVDGLWKVSVRITDAPERTEDVFAKRVILAAGAFGSTEILARSKLSLSRARLGRGFSGNGDMLGVGVSRDRKVESVAHQPSEDGGTDGGTKGGAAVGPTIVGVIEVEGKPADESGRGGYPPFVVEDGAIPFPLRRLFVEGIATRDLITRLADGNISPYHRAQRRAAPAAPHGDPIVASVETASHTPVHLIMGRDLTSGRLDFENDVLVPHYPDPEIPGHVFAYQQTVRKLVADADYAAAEGKDQKKRQERKVPIREFENLDHYSVTVHPLGGCNVGLRAESGVVNPRGQVFSGPTGDAVYESLYVLDGSILPGAVGVNPFLTIASVAYHLASRITTAQLTGLPDLKDEYKARPAPRSGLPLSSDGPETVEGLFRERLFLELSPKERSELARAFPSHDWTETPALVLDVDIHNQDIFARLENPSANLEATFIVNAALVPFDDSIPSTNITEIARFPGSVILGGYDPPKGTLALTYRRLATIFSLLSDRGADLLRALVVRIRDRIGRSSFQDKQEKGLSIGEFIQSQWILSGIHAERRFMLYEFSGVHDGASNSSQGSRRAPISISFRGRKNIDYFGEQPGPLHRLRHLPFELKAGKKTVLQARMRVDIVRITGETSALEITKSSDSPTTALALVGLGSYFARSVLSSMFWSFRRPSYSRFGTKAQENQARKMPPPEQLEYEIYSDGDPSGKRAYAPLDYQVMGHLGKDEKGRTVRLVRYRQTHRSSATKTFVLLHGLAQSSRIFYTDTVDTSMVSYLLGRGADVWLFDYGLSIGLIDEPNCEISLDDIAVDDVPWALRTIDAVTNEREGSRERVHVVAHCLGAGAVEIATLKGLLTHDATGEPLVGSLTLHGMTPWLIASEENRWRANALSLFKEKITGYFDAIPHDNPSTAESLYDALAGSFHWEDEKKSHCQNERGDQFSRTLCNRCRLFYGQLWDHSQLTAETHARMYEMMGAASLRIMRHAHACVSRGRLTDEHGANDYVRRENVAKNWNVPTLFVIGERNRVFLPESSRRSVVELKRMVESDVTVMIREIPNYGHTDIIFGKDAARDTFPLIFAGPEGLLDHSDRFAPHAGSAPGDSAMTVTGPIISRPERIDQDTVRLTMWAGTSGLSVEQPEEIRVERFTGELLPRKRPRRTEDDSERHFFLGRVSVPREHEPPSKGPGEYLPTPGPPAAERHPSAISLRGLPWFESLFDDSSPSGVSFLLGACLHPGLGPERHLSDAAFGRMRPEIEGENGVDHLLLLGDQIYADSTGDLIDPTSPLERYRKRYLEAFGGPLALVGKNAHWVMSHLPTYFSIDDHEIRNDWCGEIEDHETDTTSGSPRLDERKLPPESERVLISQEAKARAKEEERQKKDERNALDSAYRFLIHDSSPAGERGKFWYEFESRGYPFFVFDTRTRRRKAQRDERVGLIDDAQWAAFEAWAKKNKGRKLPLFLCTGSALAPLPFDIIEAPVTAGKSDGIVGFPGFLKALVELLSDIDTPIVWLGGDLHSSSVSAVTLQTPRGRIDFTHVVGSGLFAPLPFVNTPTASFDGKCVKQVFVHGDLRIETMQTLLMKDCPASFVRVACDGRELTVQGIALDATAAEATMKVQLAPAGARNTNALHSNTRARENTPSTKETDHETG